MTAAKSPDVVEDAADRLLAMYRAAGPSGLMPTYHELRATLGVSGATISRAAGILAKQGRTIRTGSGMTTRIAIPGTPWVLRPKTARAETQPRHTYAPRQPDEDYAAQTARHAAALVAAGIWFRDSRAASQPLPTAHPQAASRHSECGVSTVYEARP